MKMCLSAILAVVLWTVVGSDSLLAQQQRGDITFVPVINEVAFPEGTGPVVIIDEAHNNYHTMDGRYRVFAEYLRAHGCMVLPGTQPCSRPTLAAGDIYVIANALAERNIDDWSLPVDNAFDAEEIDAIARWVKEGGSLFLIADHMPFPGAIDSLALRFGIHFSNGFAFYDGKPGRGLMFTRGNDNLRPHWITDEKVNGSRIDSVVTFTGSAFKIDGANEALLVFGAGMQSLEPKVAWEFKEKTRKARIEGWRQGAALTYGKGRIVVFGEAAMFTAQKTEQGLPMGLNSPEGARNASLLTNIIRWLAGGGK